MVTLAIVIPTMASSEFAVLSVTALVPTAFEVFRSKSCAILYSYNAIAIATAKPFDAPPEVIPKLDGVIFFIVPPSSTKTKSASPLDVVVVGVSELPVVITVPVAPASLFISAAVDVIAVPFIASLSVTTLNVPLSSTLATSVPSLC